MQCCLEAIAPAAAHPPLTTPDAHPCHLLDPAPTLDAVEADHDLPGVDDARRSSRRGSVQRAPRRRGPKKASRHQHQAATAAEIAARERTRSAHPAAMNAVGGE